MDIFTQEQRSLIMSSIKDKNTKPEVAIRKSLFRRGFRYSLHPGKIPRKPDIYLKKYNASIFFHGCFWHGHDCKAARLPKTGTEFWKNKIDSNKDRDTRVTNELSKRNMRFLIIRGCSFKGKGKERFEKVINKTIEWLLSDSSTEEISDQCFH